jgi:putative restriction endonuclease
MEGDKRQEILQQFDQINVWTRGDERAPHKPLLILYALGRWQRRERSEVPFAAVAQDVGGLLREFGPPRQSYHPEYPFWRLQADGIWTVEADGPLASRQGQTDAKKSELLKHNARGAFVGPILAALNADPALAGDIAQRLLESHFPESVHGEILDAVGLSLEAPVAERSRRDPGFRKRVLTAYEYRCAICGYDVRLGTNLLGLDAAHIKWHQAGGPDVETNGLALCVLHHKSFDLGAFTVNADLSIMVSDEVHGSTGLQETLLRHHAQPLRSPQRPEHVPASGFLDWHGREVFRGRARHIVA